MNESILTSIKKLLGIEESYEHFDQDIIMHINSVFVILYQLGMGEEPFVIHSKEDTWDDLFPEDQDIEAVKSYIYLKVRTMFDPPSSSIHMEAINSNLKELEWRINVLIENGKIEPIDKKKKQRINHG